MVLLGCSPPEEVHGTAIDTLGSAEDPGSLSQSIWRKRTIQAQVPTNAGYQILSAQVDDDGNFLIPAVPAGSYWLAFPDEQTALPRTANLFVWTDSRSFDLGLRGQTAALIATARMPMPTPVSGLLPVQAGDFIEAYGTSHIWSTRWDLTAAGAVTATWPADQAIPLRYDPTEQLVVKQWRKSTAGGVSIESVVRAGSSASPAELESTLSFTLSDAVPATFGATIDHAAFLDPISGLTGPLDTSLALMASADSSSAPVGTQEWLVRLINQATPGGDPSASELPYVDPYPTSWSRRYELRYLKQTSYPVEGTPDQASCRSGLDLFGPASDLRQAPLRPSLSLPQGLSIDGRTAMVSRDGAALSPTVTWQPPALGTVSFYVLRIVRLENEPEWPTPTIVAGSFLTPKTEVTIPPGVLKSGTQYYLELIAVTGLDGDALTAPRTAFARSNLQSSAHVCSASFRTQ